MKKKKKNVSTNKKQSEYFVCGDAATFNQIRLGRKSVSNSTHSWIDQIKMSRGFAAN